MIKRQGIWILFLSGVLLLPALQASAQTSWYHKPANRTERHFDRNKDGYLDTFEFGVLRSHVLFGWPLANSKKKKAFDSDQDGLLEPVEYQRYLNRKQVPLEVINPSRIIQ